MTANLKLESTYDRKTTSRKLDNWPIVFHCHYYSSLFAQLADDAEAFDGKIIMVKAMAESIMPILEKYYQDHEVTSTDEKKHLAEQYFSAVGLGKFTITEATVDKGAVEMTSSHLDSAWIIRWGKWDRPINFMGQGFLIAVFASIFNKSLDDYQVIEEKSIVKGDDKSIFKIIRSAT